MVKAPVRTQQNEKQPHYCGFLVQWQVCQQRPQRGQHKQTVLLPRTAMSSIRQHQQQPYRVKVETSSLVVSQHFHPIGNLVC